MMMTIMVAIPTPERHRQQFTIGANGAVVLPTKERPQQFRMNIAFLIVLLIALSPILVIDAFSPPSYKSFTTQCNNNYDVKLGLTSTTHPSMIHHRKSYNSWSSSSTSSSFSSSSLQSTKVGTSLSGADRNTVYTVQILMSDTGGGHRASANAIRDALDVLHPGTFQCDIVDIYTDYGPFWPYNDYVAMYRLMSKYSWMWDFFYRFGETDIGLWLNEVLLTTFCYEPFKDCMNRMSGSTQKRADMVISVHPLCQDIPLKILAELDGKDDATTINTASLLSPSSLSSSSSSLPLPLPSKTPFVTVVTDLGGAHKTWFNPGYVRMKNIITMQLRN
jgi:hypothetical protein